MPNSDYKFGTYNKQTVVRSQVDDESKPKTIFTTVQEAVDFFISPHCQQVHDECCTNLEYALVRDENGDYTKLKVTFDFGTKGDPNISEDEDWPAEWKNRSKLCPGEPNMCILDNYTDPNSAEHLF